MDLKEKIVSSYVAFEDGVISTLIFMKLEQMPFNNLKNLDFLQKN